MWDDYNKFHFLYFKFSLLILEKNFITVFLNQTDNIWQGVRSQMLPASFLWKKKKILFVTY